MPIVTNNQHRSWLKRAANMKLSSDASVLRITYEGLTHFQFFMDFDCNIIEITADVPNMISAKKSVPGTNIRMISICRLVVATNAVKYYTVIERTSEFDIMHSVNVLGEFKTDYDTNLSRSYPCQ